MNTPLSFSFCVLIFESRKKRQSLSHQNHITKMKFQVWALTERDNTSAAPKLLYFPGNFIACLLTVSQSNLAVFWIVGLKASLLAGALTYSLALGRKVNSGLHVTAPPLIRIKQARPLLPVRRNILDASWPLAVLGPGRLFQALATVMPLFLFSFQWQNTSASASWKYCTLGKQIQYFPQSSELLCWNSAWTANIKPPPQDRTHEADGGKNFHQGIKV